jgi:hypothetical protein
VITSKPANGDQVKTGQRERLDRVVYSAESFGGKLVFVRQLRGVRKKRRQRQRVRHGRSK